MHESDGEQIMIQKPATVNLPRPAGGTPARRWRVWLAAMALAAVSILAPFGPGEAARDDVTPIGAAPNRAAEIYRPGGMAPGDTERALSHDPGAVAGCLPAGAADVAQADAGAGAERAELSRLFEIIATSATGRAVLERARRYGVYVCIDSKTDLLAYYFAGRHMAGVNAALPQGGKIAFLAHELAHVPQHPAYSDNRYSRPRT